MTKAKADKMSKPRAPERARDRHRLVTEAITIREAPEGGGLATVTATLARGNIINRNLRYYSATVLERAATAARDKVAAGKLIGLMDHPNYWDGDGDKGRPERVVIRWNRLWMDGPDLKGEGTIVATALGRDLLAMYDAKVHIGLSTNAYATSHFEKAEDVPAPWDGDPNELIQVIDDIEELLTIDVVNDPSNVYAQIEQETREARIAYREEHVMTEKKPAAEDASANEAHVEAQKQLEAVKAELEATKAKLARQARESIVREELARYGDAPEPLAKAAMLTALAAETDEAAREEVQALLESSATGNGNNGVPSADQKEPTGDPLRETRLRLKLN